MGVTLYASSTDSDQDLILRWKRGEELAATELVARHAEPLERFVRSLGVNGAEAEVAQDSFVRAFGALDSFRGDSSFRTWLFTIARRLVLDRWRKERRLRRMEVLDDDDSVTQFDALDKMVGDETLQRLKQAVDSLSPNQKQVFLMRVEQGLSYKDIAEIVGSTEGAMRVHYHNAMRAIKDFLL